MRKNSFGRAGSRGPGPGRLRVVVSCVLVVVVLYFSNRSIASYLDAGGSSSSLMAAVAEMTSAVLQKTWNSTVAAAVSVAHFGGRPEQNRASSGSATTSAQEPPAQNQLSTVAAVENVSSRVAAPPQIFFPNQGPLFAATSLQSLARNPTPASVSDPKPPAPNAPSVVVTDVWNNSGTSWETAGDWTPAGPPTAVDIASFDPTVTSSDYVVRNPVISSADTALAVNVNNSFLGGTYTFTGSGSLTIGSGGMTIGGFGTQTINGPTLAGAAAGNLTFNIGTNAGLTLEGATTAVTNPGGITLRGGTLTLDNNFGADNTNRLGDTAGVTFNGGKLSLVGNSAGSSETVGSFTLGSGSSTISVTNNGGTGATLTFSDSGSLRDSTSGTINFVGSGTGTLGSAGNNPRIAFTGAIFTNTTNGALANTSSATAATIGWARVNDTSWAGVGANGIVALAETARSSATLGSAAAWELTTFTPSTTTTTLAANLGVSTTPLLLKITPSASGQSLASGGFNINAVAVMLAGTTDFSITGTGSLFGTVGSTRYIYVTDANTVLSVSQSFAGAQQPFNKAGAGTVFLNGSANQLSFTSVQNINLLEGTLRGTLTTLGGGTSSGGAFTTINLYGGVLEISGGGSFTRASGLTGAAGGGGIKWDGGGTARGDGGFSAISGDATVSLVTTIGGATAATPIWNTGGFVSTGSALAFGSTKSDSTLTFTNSVGLDNGTAGTYAAREIRVTQGTGVAADKTIMSGAITGSTSSDLMKTGTGNLELQGDNTFAGRTLIEQGTLTAAGIGANQALKNTASILVNATGTLAVSASDQINDSAGITLNGGTFRMNGVSEGTTAAAGAGVGALTLTSSSFIDLAGTNPALHFAASNAQPWTGTLSIYNWSGTLVTGNGGEQIAFGSDGTGLTSSQLNSINFYSDLGSTFLGTAAFAPDLDGEIVPIPEPSTWIGGALALGFLGWSQRKRFARLLRQAA